nr:myosin-17-like [Ipomoea batatas]
MLACKLYEQLRREAAAIKIQKSFRCFVAWKSYSTLRHSAITLQTGMRAMVARDEFRFRKQTKASIKIQASRETGALKEAKDKLEKKVEELTWRLQFEKRLRTELEETKAQETAKLQEALQSMQKQVDEANARVIQEQEAARKAIEEAPPVIKETPVIVQDTEKLNALIADVENLKDMSVAVASPKEPESEEKPQKSLNEKQQENQDLLIKCISQDLGFSGGKPVAACVVYKCLLHWRSFEVERTSVFDRIIQTVASSIEVADNNDVLAYWLCNTATLLMLLQQTLKASGAASLTPQRRRSSSASLFGRMSQSAGLSFLNGRVLGRLDDLRQVEAKYPALLFKQQLTAFLEKIYGLIRDNLKKEISPLLGLCIQAPRTSRGSLVKGRSQANAAAQQALIAHWQSIVKRLDNYLKMMKANYVPPFLVRKVFTQIFSFINVQLFNSLLLRRECCSFSNGEYVKSGLGELEQWCCYATEEYVGSAWDELKHIRQAVGFLVRIGLIVLEI